MRNALKAAQNLSPEVNAIWVAEGIYKPVNDIFVDNYQDYNFALLEGVNLFGHFGGIGTYETSTNQRNFADANNETVLEGQIGQNYYDAVYNIVTAADIDNAVLDGFTVKGGYYWEDEDGVGVSLINSDISIVNCKFTKNYDGCGVRVKDYSFPDIRNCVFVNNSNSGIKVSYNSGPTVTSCSFYGTGSEDKYGISIDHYSKVVVEKTLFSNHQIYGVYAYRGDITLTDCNFINNKYAVSLDDSNAAITYCSISNCWDGDGIYAAESSNLTIDNTTFSNNRKNALFATDCNLTLVNSVLHHNGECGIYLEDLYSSEIRNNTIKNNWIYKNGTNEIADNRAGILLKNQVSAPLIRNNTILDNGEYGVYSDDAVEQSITNCIVWGHDIELSECDASYCCIEGGGGGTNIESDPCFVNPCTGNYHLTSDSNCIDAGSGDFPGETDIDGEDRVRDGDADGDDVVDMGADEYCWPKADYNRDEIVNFTDYSEFADKWFCNDPCISLDIDSDVDVCDLALFCNDWMWTSHWGNKYDLNNDEVINFIDHAVFADSWLLPFGDPDFNICCDFKEDGTIDLNDLAILVENWLWASPAKYIEMMKLSAPESVASESTVAEPLTQEQIEELLAFIDELWENGELGDLTYEEYLEFRDSIMNSAAYQTTAFESFELMIAEPVLTQDQIDDMIDFVDGLWEQGELQDLLTYDKYLEFRESIEESISQ